MPSSSRNEGSARASSSSQQQSYRPRTSSQLNPASPPPAPVDPEVEAARLREARAALLIGQGKALLLAVAVDGAPLEEVKRLLKNGSPTWYQDEETGWGPLHFAAERGESEIVGALLKAGAVWNAVDHLGYTAGDISLSINDWTSYTMIRNEGLRAEILHHAMAAVKSNDEDEEPVDSNTESSTAIHTQSGSNSNLTLRQDDTTSAGDNLTFLASKLVYEKGEDGKERVLDADGNGVMMGWEEPLMVEHVKWMCDEHPHSQPGGGGMSVLNVGFGLGIVDKLFQSKKPLNHIIIEAHPQVLAHIRDTGFDKLPGVTILEGRWQDWINDSKIGEVIEMTEGARGFDGVFVDTFAEGYEDLKAFFEFLPDLLDPSEGIFSFWNGLGATNPTIYDVASNLAEFHLEDVGMTVEWHDVQVGDIEETWNGVRRKYWDLPVYRLPIARMNIG